MDKRTYYVNVGTGEVLEDPSALNYEFVISATDEEFDKLQELFEEIDNSSQASYAFTWYPWEIYTADASKYDREYDYYLSEIYRTLHQLGNAQTRQHIESMNVLENGV